MNKFIQSFNWAMNGIQTVWREEVNFRIELVIGFLVVTGGIYYRFTKLEWAFIVASIAAVLGAEMINTAIEDLCNKVEPNTDPVIGKIKDIMGGLVLVVSAVAAAIGIMVFTNHF